WSAVGALALAVGPLLGGLLSQHAAWGWIFFINVPVGLATMALAAWAIRRDGPGERRERIDLPGLVLSAGALFTLTYGLIEGHDKGGPWERIPGSFDIGGPARAGVGAVGAGADGPMGDVGLFAERVFTGGIVAVLMWGFGLFGIYFFTSLYLQNVLGF